uniref:Uncharacterized protein n=1 Tax=Arundo donax TaxID=35708 RepID=A0A0A9DIE1_ARUDO
MELSTATTKFGRHALHQSNST